MKLHTEDFLSNKWLLIIPLHIKNFYKPKENSSSSKTSTRYFMIHSLKELFTAEPPVAKMLPSYSNLL